MPVEELEIFGVALDFVPNVRLDKAPSFRAGAAKDVVRDIIPEKFKLWSYKSRAP